MTKKKDGCPIDKKNCKSSIKKTCKKSCGKKSCNNKKIEPEVSIPVQNSTQTLWGRLKNLLGYA